MSKKNYVIVIDNSHYDIILRSAINLNKNVIALFKKAWDIAYYRNYSIHNWELHRPYKRISGQGLTLTTVNLRVSIPWASSAHL